MAALDSSALLARSYLGWTMSSAPRPQVLIVMTRKMKAHSKRTGSCQFQMSSQQYAG